VLQGTNLIGAALAGFLIVEFGIASILWLDVGTFIIALGLLLSLGPGKVLDQSQQADSEGGQGRGALSRFMQDIFAGIRFLWHKPVLRTFVFIDTMQSFLTTLLLGVLLPVCIQQQYGSTTRLGFLLAAYTTGTLVSAMLYGLVEHRLPRRRLIVALGLLSTLALGLFISPVPLGITLLALLLMGAEQGPISAIANAQIQRQTPPALLGRVITAPFAFALLGGPLGTLLGGLAIDYLGLQFTMLLVLSCYLIRWIILHRDRALHTLYGTVDTRAFHSGAGW